MHTARTRSRSAFTFVELTLAGVLLAMAVVPSLGALQTLVRQTAETRLRVVARTLARGALERLRCEPLAVLAARLGSYEAGAAVIGADPALRLPAGPLATLAQGAGFARFARLESAAPGQGVLRVRVTWSEAGQTQSYEIATLVVDELAPAEVR